MHATFVDITTASLDVPLVELQPLLSMLLLTVRDCSVTVWDDNMYVMSTVGGRGGGFGCYFMLGHRSNDENIAL